MILTGVPRARDEVASAPRRWHFLLLALIWTVFAVYGSLVPLRYRPVSFAAAYEQFTHLPPLWVGMGSRADWVANILLFIPLTFFWMGAFVAGRSRIAATLAAVILAMFAAAAAVGLEFTQIWFVGRTVSRNDILAETIGGLVGVVAWLVAGRHLIEAWRSYAADRHPRATLRRILGLYLVGFALFSVIPLDLTISVTDLYGKYRRGLVILIPFAYEYDSPVTIAYQFFADVATFIPVGAWVALSGWSRLRGLSPFMSGVVGGGLIALAMEIAQLVVLSRFTDSTDIILGAIGAGIGAWLVARSDHAAADRPAVVRGAQWRSVGVWAAVLIGYSLFLAVGFLYPFDSTQNRALLHLRYEQFFRVPFLALYQGPEFNALKQVLVRLLLFAPVGVVIARLASFARLSTIRLLVTLVGLAYAGGLALGLEMIQIFMPSKTADSTEVVICFAGAAGGWLVARRLFASPPGPAAVP